MALYPVEGSEEVKGQIAEVRRPSSTGVRLNSSLSLCNLTSNLETSARRAGAATMPEKRLKVGRRFAVQGDVASVLR